MIKIKDNEWVNLRFVVRVTLIPASSGSPATLRLWINESAIEPESIDITDGPLILDAMHELNL